MPSPAGHVVAGLAIHLASAPRPRELRRAAIVCFCSLAPDLDLALRFLDGRNHHQRESHSVGAALLACLAVWLLERGRPGRTATALVAAGAWLAHVALDLLGNDTHPPVGVMALWPLTTAFVDLPRYLFLDIGRTLDVVTLRHNAVAVAWEMVVLGPWLWWAWSRRARGDGSGLGEQGGRGAAGHVALR